MRTSGNPHPTSIKPLRETAIAALLLGWAVPLVAAVQFTLAAVRPTLQANAPLESFPHLAAAESAAALAGWWLSASAVAAVARAVRRPRGRATGAPRTGGSGR